MSAASEQDWSEDERLIGRWLNGSTEPEREEAGQQLLARHVDAVIRRLRNMVRTNVEDFVHETFVRAFDGVRSGKLRDPKAFRSYLIGTAIRVVISHNRKWSRETEFDPERHSTEDVRPGPFDIVVQKEEQRILLKALRRIPFESQVLLELYYFEREDHRSIAKILGLKYDQVRKKTYDARKKLKEVIMRYEADPQLLTSTLGDIEGWAANIRQQLAGGQRPKAV